MGKQLNQLLPQLSDDIERHALTAGKGYRCELNGKGKDGFLLSLESTFSKMPIDGSRMFTCLLRDSKYPKKCPNGRN